MENNFDVVILGAGMAGLICGQELRRTGKSVCILEKEDCKNSAIKNDGLFYGI